MANKPVLTLKDILKRKEFFEKKSQETMELEIRELNANIVISKPDKELCVDCLEMEDAADGDRYLVYEIVKEPNLKDPELQKEFGCVSPIDIVDVIFSPGTVAGIAKEGMRFAGYFDGVKVVEDLKN